MLCYEYNLFLIQRTKIRGTGPLPIGRVTIEVETSYVESRPAGPLQVVLRVDGAVVGEGTVPVSAPLLFTANDCLDIGQALGSPVSLDSRDRSQRRRIGGTGQAQMHRFSHHRRNPTRTGTRDGSSRCRSSVVVARPGGTACSSCRRTGANRP